MENKLNNSTIISKFMINRNHLNFMYTEKHCSRDGIIYYVREDKDFVIYNQDTFQSIYGNDKKISLYNFLERVDMDYFYDCKNNDIDILKIKLSCQDVKKPSLQGYNYSLISLIDDYNDHLNRNKDLESEEMDLLKEPVLDYEEQYKRVLELQGSIN